MAMNVCIFQGRLTKDPEMSSGTKGNGESYIKARFSLAVDKTNGGEDADFPDIVCFGGLAEHAEKYLKKGTRVLVRSSFQSGSYTNKDGVKVYTSNFVAQSIDFN